MVVAIFQKFAMALPLSYFEVVQRALFSSFKIASQKDANSLSDEFEKKNGNDPMIY